MNNVSAAASMIADAVNATSTPFPTTTGNVSGNTTLWTKQTPEQAIQNFWIGLALAVTSACFTGSSFIFKKKGLLNASRAQGTRAGIIILYFNVAYRFLISLQLSLCGSPQRWTIRLIQGTHNVHPLTLTL